MVVAVAVCPSSYGDGAAAAGPHGLDLLATGSSRPAGGNQLWVGRYNDSRNGTDHANDVAVSPGGTMVLVTGDAVGPSSAYLTDFLTIGYDAASGATVWTRRHDGPGHGQDSACCVAVSPDGSAVFVTGYVTLPGRETDVETIAYATSDGHVLWTTSYGAPSQRARAARGRGDTWRVRPSDTPGPYGTVPHAITVSPDGSRVFITGSSEGKFLTVAYGAGDGVVEWVNTSDLSYLPNAGYSIGVSPDGSVVFATGGTIPFAAAGFTQAYDAQTGNILWSALFDNGGSAKSTSLSVSPDGSRVYVSGFDIGSNDFDYVTSAYDATSGGQLWLQHYDGPAHDRDQAHWVSVSPDGQQVFVTGWSSASSLDYATIAYDAATGQPEWITRYDGPAGSRDSSASMAVTPDGTRVVVTGWSHGSGTRYDYATIAYDAETGTGLWLARYDGPPSGPDLAASIALSPDGACVYVTGSSVGYISGSDFATVAYDDAAGPTRPRK